MIQASLTPQKELKFSTQFKIFCSKFYYQFKIMHTTDCRTRRNETGLSFTRKKMDLIPRKKRGLSWDQRKLDHNGEFECRGENFQPGMIKPYQILGAVWFEEIFFNPYHIKKNFII